MNRNWWEEGWANRWLSRICECGRTRGEHAVDATIVEGGVVLCAGFSPTDGERRWEAPGGARAGGAG